MDSRGPSAPGDRPAARRRPPQRARHRVGARPARIVGVHDHPAHVGAHPNPDRPVTFHRRPVDRLPRPPPAARHRRARVHPPATGPPATTPRETARPSTCSPRLVLWRKLGPPPESSQM